MNTVKEALDKIKEAELKTDRIIEQAKDEALKILQKAKSEKERLIGEAIERARFDSQKLKIRIEEEALEEVAAIKRQSKGDIEVLKRKASNNVNKAVEFLKAKMGL